MNRELTDPRDIKSKTLPQLQEELAALGGDTSPRPSR